MDVLSRLVMQKVEEKALTHIIHSEWTHGATLISHLVHEKDIHLFIKANHKSLRVVKSTLVV